MAHNIGPDQDDQNIDLGRYIHEKFLFKRKKGNIFRKCEARYNQ